MINDTPIPDVQGGDVSRISATERHYRQDRKRIRELERLGDRLMIEAQMVADIGTADFGMTPDSLRAAIDAWRER